MTTYFILVLGMYFILLLALLLGWRKVTLATGPKEIDPKGITVLVPFRNEENRIHILIHSLTNLNYPLEKYNVIFINDHSDDNSVNVVKALISDKPNFQLEHLGNDKLGKKEALSLGVRLANHEIIATTDADCLTPANWLTSMNEAFANEKVMMAFGGVNLNGPATLFSNLQAMEFAGLVGSGVASLGLGHFTMCNGANLGFRKSVFQSVGGYEGNLQIPSGDDEFLARKIIRAYPGSLCFLNRKNAVVTAKPASRLKEFISQRIRWAGKWKYNSSWGAKGLALFVLIVQLTWLALIMSWMVESTDLLLGAFLISTKVFLEFWFLFTASKFLGSRWNWSAFIVLQLIYPIYVIGIGVGSQVMPYHWKGRRLSHKV